MKIAMITDLFPPVAVGGYEISCKETSDELRRRGHAVVILTGDRGVNQTSTEDHVHRILCCFPDFPSSENSSFITYRLRKRYFQFSHLIKNRRNYWITREFLKKEKPDLVMIWNTVDIGIGPVLAAQHEKYPCVFNISDYWLLNLKTELVDEPNPVKKIYHAIISGLIDFNQLDISYLLMTSNLLKQTHIKHGFPEHNIHIIPRGIRSDLVLPEKELHELPHHKDGLIRLLFIGRLVSDKAPDMAIDTIQVIKEKYGIKKIQLDIFGFGSDDYVHDLKSRVSNLRLDENIQFPGWYDHSQLYQLYQEYDALLFPARWEEPFGRTIIEAMSQGLPVITSKLGGPLEIIEDGRNGFLVPVDDPPAFAEAVMKIMNNPNLAQRIRIAGVKTVKEQFTLEHVVDLGLEYLQKIVDYGSPNN